MKTRNKDKDSYIKFISVISTILHFSDSSHPIRVEEIAQRVHQRNNKYIIDARTVNKFVAMYNEYYEDNIIESFKKGRFLYYYAVTRQLDLMEARAIVDLVYGSDFFTYQTKENYKKRIQDIFSIHTHPYFTKTLDLHMTKNENPKAFYEELEKIVYAIQAHKKIRFIYQKPSLIHDSGKITELAPIDTIFSNNEYYLLCQGSKNSKECIQYRLDYIKDVEILENSEVVFNNFELEAFREKLKHMTYMYGEGKLESVTLDFKAEVYSNMIDKFGKSIQPKHIKDNIYRVHVRHIINNTFYSWIVGFGGTIQISGNSKQVSRFQEFLRSNFDLKQNF